MPILECSSKKLNMGRKIVSRHKTVSRVLFLDYDHTPTVQGVLNMSTMAAGSHLNIVCMLCYVIAGHDKFMHIFLEDRIT